MSRELVELLSSLVGAAVVIGIAVAIRIRGPRGLVHPVDWARVSDERGFGQFCSIMCMMLGGIIIGHALAHYAFAADDALDKAITTAFVFVLVAAIATMLTGMRRYQDKPAARKTDGRR